MVKRFLLFIFVLLSVLQLFAIDLSGVYQNELQDILVIRRNGDKYIYGWNLKDRIILFNRTIQFDEVSGKIIDAETGEPWSLVANIENDKVELVRFVSRYNEKFTYRKIANELNDLENDYLIFSSYINDAVEMAYAYVYFNGEYIVKFGVDNGGPVAIVYSINENGIIENISTSEIVFSNGQVIIKGIDIPFPAFRNGFSEICGRKEWEEMQITVGRKIILSKYHVDRFKIIEGTGLSSNEIASIRFQQLIILETGAVLFDTNHLMWDVDLISLPMLAEGGEGYIKYELSSLYSPGSEYLLCVAECFSLKGDCDANYRQLVKAWKIDIYFKTNQY